MSDFGTYFPLASKKAFGDNIVNKGCFFHLKQAVERNLSRLNVRTKSGIIIFGINILSETDTPESLEDVWSLLKQYWVKYSITAEFISIINLIL